MHSVCLKCFHLLLVSIPFDLLFVEIRVLCGGKKELYIVCNLCNIKE